MKNPNGAGSVYKLTGNRRKPWGVRITIGYNPDTGSPKQRLLGAYATRKEAIEALSAASYSPVTAKNHTLDDIYRAWSEKKYPTLAPRTVRSYRDSWALLRQLHRCDAATVKLGQLQAVFDATGKPKRTLEIARNVLAQVMNYAIKYEYTSSDRREMVRYIDLSAASAARTVKRSIFTASEITRLWEANARDPLILIYTGMRIGEYLALTSADIHADRVIIRSAKTDAGIREIPLLPNISPLLRPVDQEYSNFRKRVWTPLMESLGMRHTIHDTRHTFATLCTEGGMDPRHLKAIIGHKSQDVTEGVYTHISFPALQAALFSALQNRGEKSICY